MLHDSLFHKSTFRDYFVGIGFLKGLASGICHKSSVFKIVCLTQSNDFLCDEVKAAVQGVRLAIFLELNQSTRSTMLLQ